MRVCNHDWNQLKRIKRGLRFSLQKKSFFKAELNAAEQGLSPVAVQQ